MRTPGQQLLPVVHSTLLAQEHLIATFTQVSGAGAGARGDSGDTSGVVGFVLIMESHEILPCPINLRNETVERMLWIPYIKAFKCIRFQDMSLWVLHSVVLPLLSLDTPINDINRYATLIFIERS